MDVRDISGGDSRSNEEDDVLMEHVTILLLGVTFVTATVTSWKRGCFADVTKYLSVD